MASKAGPFAALLTASPPGCGVSASSSTGGAVHVAAACLTWQPGSGAKPHIIQLRDVQKLQQSPRDKPGCKLRVVLHDGSAYVFEFTGTGALQGRDAVAAAYAAANAAASPAAAAAAATSGKAAAVEAPRAVPPSASDQLARVLGASANAAFEAADVAQLKRQCLEADADLAGKYTSVVATGAVSDAEFWQAHAHVLLDAGTARGRVGLPSARPDSLRADETADGRATYFLDSRRKVAIFVKEVRVYDAFSRFVPARMDEAQFWHHYLRAALDRQALERTDGVPRVGRDMDVAALQPADFFELYRRGELDATAGDSTVRAPPPRLPASASRAAGSAGSAAASASAAAAGAGGVVDPSCDLLATAEDSGGRGLASSSRGPVDAMRGGYGTGQLARAYAGDDADEDEGAAAGAGAGNGGVGGDSLQPQQHRRLRARDMAELNRYSRLVLRNMGADGTGGGGESAGGSGAGARAEAAVAGRAADSGGVGDSAADDLPDLYAPPADRGMLSLRVDAARMRAAVDAQAEGPADGGGGGSWGLRIAAGGWAAAAPDAHGAGGSEEEGGGGSGAVGAKRQRPEDDAGGDAPAPAAAAVGEEEMLMLLSALPSAAQLLASKPAAAGAKRLARELSARAHDLFAAQGRNRHGIAASVPREWAQFALARFRANKELLLHFWAAAGAAAGEQQQVGGAHGGAHGGAAAAAASRRAAHAQRIERELAQLRVQRDRVQADGPFEHLPPLPPDAAAAAAAGTAARGAQLQQPPRPEGVVVAKGEVLALLAMLMGPLQRAAAHNAQLRHVGQVQVQR